MAYEAPTFFLTLFYMSLSLLTGTLATLAHVKLFAAFSCSLQSWLLSLELPPWTL